MDYGYVSVVMPVYNNANYIKKTINSVLNQSYSKVEIIVVDDCSSDNSVNIIKSIKDSRIKLFVNEKNKGAAFCRNLAIEQSTGDYIAFLDGDDLWTKDKLEKQLSFMNLNNISFSYTDYYVLNDDTNQITCSYTGPKRINHRKFRRLDYIGCLTAMYKRNLYPDLSIPNDIYKRNDYALWLKLSEKAPCYLLKEKLAIYRKRNNSISSISKFKLIKFHKILFTKLYGFGRIKSTFFALRNVFFYVFKRFRYKRKVNLEINEIQF